MFFAVPGQKVNEGKMKVGKEEVCCKDATDEQITTCVNKAFQCGAFETETCEAQVEEAFTKCCMEDPTPWWLWYPDNFPF